MTIRFTRAYKKYTVGQEATLPDKVEFTLIKEGIATKVYGGASISFSEFPRFTRTATNSAGDATPVVALTKVIPGGLMGPNSSLRINIFAEVATANTNVKQITVKINGVSIAAPSNSANNTRVLNGQLLFQNQGSVSSNKTANSGFSWIGVSANNPVSTNIDTSQEMTVTIELVWGAASAITETMTLHGAVIEVL